MGANIVFDIRGYWNDIDSLTVMDVFGGEFLKWWFGILNCMLLVINFVVLFGIIIYKSNCLMI